MTFDHFDHLEFPGEEGTPRLIMLHGTGGNENDLLPIAEALDPDFGVLSPRGLVSEMGMNRWFRRIEEGVFDLEDLKFRTQELGDWLHLVRTDLNEENRPWIAFGYSNGANIAANLILQGYDIFLGAILVRPMLTDETKEGAKSNTKVQIQYGKHDQICPADHAPLLANQLEKVGADVTLMGLDTGHQFTQGDLALAQQALLDWVSF